MVSWLFKRLQVRCESPNVSFGGGRGINPLLLLVPLVIVIVLLVLVALSGNSTTTNPVSATPVTTAQAQRTSSTRQIPNYPGDYGVLQQHKTLDNVVAEKLAKSKTYSCGPLAPPQAMSSYSLGTYNGYKWLAWVSPISGSAGADLFSYGWILTPNGNILVIPQAYTPCANRNDAVQYVLDQAKSILQNPANNIDPAVQKHIEDQMVADLTNIIK